jgi:membrane associated rhomboid family serine protease
VIPLRDSVKPRRFAVVTATLIVINTLVFFICLAQPKATFHRYNAPGRVVISGFDAVTLEYGFTPCDLAHDCARPGYGEAAVHNAVVQVRVTRRPVYVTLLAAMFLHGGWLHLAGNMLFLWIFGNNVEDRLGRGWFLVFYLLSGLAASLMQFAVDTNSDVPNIGASGAIAGVLGGYLLLYPRARVLTVVPLLVFFYVVEIPAVLVLVTWFGLQVLDGSAAIATPGSPSGVAYFAHIGGFACGFLLVKPFGWLRRGRPVRYA